MLRDLINEACFRRPTAVITIVPNCGCLYHILVPRGRDPFGPHLKSKILCMRKVLVLNFQPIRFARFDKESVNRGLPVLEPTRGLYPWCWPEGSRPLGTRIIHAFITAVNHRSGSFRKRRRWVQRGQEVTFVLCDWWISIHFVFFCFSRLLVAHVHIFNSWLMAAKNVNRQLGFELHIPPVVHNSKRRMRSWKSVGMF